MFDLIMKISFIIIYFQDIFGNIVIIITANQNNYENNYQNAKGY